MNSTKSVSRAISSDAPAKTMLPQHLSPKETSTKKISFSKITIREYSQTLGDNPSSKNGPPISLDWKYTEKKAMELDQYEASREPRRARRDLVLGFNEKRTILQNCSDVTAENIVRVEMEVLRIQRQRSRSSLQPKMINSSSRADQVVNTVKRNSKAGRRVSAGRRCVASRAA